MKHSGFIRFPDNFKALSEVSYSEKQKHSKYKRELDKDNLIDNVIIQHRF